MREVAERGRFLESKVLSLVGRRSRHEVVEDVKVPLARADASHSGLFEVVL